jgi:hypothetical protein
MIAQSPYTVDSTLLVAIIWDRQVKSGHLIGVQPSEPTTAGYIRRLYASNIMYTEVSRWSAPIVKQRSVLIFNLSFKIDFGDPHRLQYSSSLRKPKFKI